MTKQKNITIPVSVENENEYNRYKSAFGTFAGSYTLVAMEKIIALTEQHPQLLDMLNKGIEPTKANLAKAFGVNIPFIN